jgi:hypothetical protein
VESIHRFSAFLFNNSLNKEVRMSRLERMFKRSHSKKFEKIFKEAKKKACDPAFSSVAEKVGIPLCPKCNAALLSGFGDSSGDYYQCLKCGAVIPVSLEDGKE